MRVHGDKYIIRRKGIDKLKDYHGARELLEEDFYNLCGYCGKNGMIMHQKFHIDHFVPQSKYPEGKNDYYNLVLACPKCNLIKSNKWPTGDVRKANDGKQGFVDPATAEFDKHVERNNEGYVIGVTSVGKSMCSMLNLDIRRTDIYWNIEKLREIQKKLDILYNEGQLGEQEKNYYIELTQMLNLYIDAAFEKGE